MPIFTQEVPSKLAAAAPVSDWKKLHRLLCLLHSLQTVHPTMLEILKKRLEDQYGDSGNAPQGLT